MSLSFLLVIKKGHEQARVLAEEMRDWLAARGVSARSLEHSSHEETKDALRRAAGGTDVVVVLGGDGTFISAARSLAGTPAGLLGVNCGRVGFLTEVAAAAWRESFADLLDGRLQRRNRMVLAWRVERNGEAVLSGWAINDVVLGRGSLARVVSVRLGAREPGAEPVDLGWMRADGIIVSSPMGSSAYSLSAHGPLLHPDLSAILVTAIAPFLGSLPPLALSGESRVHLECAGAGSDQEVWLTVDGQQGHPLKPGDLVDVTGVPGGISVFTRPGLYLEGLRGRGFIRECSGRAAPESGSEPRTGDKI